MYPPRAAITACILRGILLIKSWHLWTGILSQAVLNTWKSSVQFGVLMCFFAMPRSRHRFSIGFKSGLCGGQISDRRLLFAIQSFTTLDRSMTWCIVIHIKVIVTIAQKMCRRYCVVLKDVNVALRIEVSFNPFHKTCPSVRHSAPDSYPTTTKLHSWHYATVLVLLM